jgi:UDP-N-acetylglucosamine 1-carboxyvinyltransferase
MSRLLIKGQRRLSGSFTPAGNKNAALPMLAATVLTDEPVTIQNVPQIQDVHVMLTLLTQMGATVEHADRSVTVCAKGLKSRRLDPELCRRVRASILFAGPLAARHGRAVIFPPGGDVIGRRRLDTHFYGLKALGIAVEGGAHYTFRRRTLRGADLLLDEASVTATENILMAAVLADGETTVFNAACEPHVQDLGRMLVKMGAKIEGLGTNRIVIQGVSKLHGATHACGMDYIEAGSFICAAAATHGDLRVRGIADDPALPIIRRGFERIGVKWTTDGDDIVVPAARSLRIPRDLGSAVPTLADGVWPMFPSDLMSVAIVLATQARGSVLFFEKLFESRMYFVDRLIEMGAHVVQCDPHRVVVQGPTRLHAIHMSSPDIRAGMAMIIAALCAKGESIIDQAQVIDRGYERVDERLRELGADVVREE